MTRELRRISPFAELGRPLFGPASLLSDEFFNRVFSTPLARDVKQWSDKEGTHIEYVVAGYDKENIDILYNDKTNVVTVAASQGYGPSRRSFNASFALDDRVSKEDIKTSYENGLLRFDIKETEKEEERNRLHRLELE
jgi:HSP20 family molecular chaperone IbpA